MAQLQEGEMWIGELAKQTGISTATINFYVQEGLVPAPRKLNRTRSAYSDIHLRALRIVKRCQDALGMSLAQIKRQLSYFGMDDDGLRKVEAIGSLQPLPPVFGDPTHAEIEHFEPKELHAFAEYCSVDPSFIAELVEVGLVRPRNEGQFDANDAWQVRTIQALRNEGIELEQLLYNVRAIPQLTAMAHVMNHLVARHAARLRSREMRFRDLLKPVNGIAGYMFQRVHEEDDPDWRSLMFDD